MSAPSDTSPDSTGLPTSPALRGGFQRTEATYSVMATTFAVVLVLTNIIGVKLFVLFGDGRPAWVPGAGPLTLTAGIVTYPLTFLLTDLVAELWGRKRAEHMVRLGFAMSLLMLAVVALGVALEPSAFWGIPSQGLDMAAMQSAFEATFYLPGLLLFASMTAYLVAQLFDVRLYHFWWRITGGRHMWIRNNGSTWISQLVDTIIVNGIFLKWGLDMQTDEIVAIIGAVYVCKVMLAVVDTPLLYLGRALLRRYFGLEGGVAPDRAPLE